MTEEQADEMLQLLREILIAIKDVEWNTSGR